MEPDSTSENTENSPICPESMHLLSASNTISDLLYQNQPIEPDSTSEGKDDQTKKKKFKPTPEIGSSSSTTESLSNDQYLQYLVDSEYQQETPIIASVSLPAPNWEKIFEKPFQCPFPGCSYRVAHKRNIYRHKRQKHGTANANGNRLVSRHVCNICGKRNLNYSNFKRHHDANHADMSESYEEKRLELVDTINEE